MRSLNLWISKNVVVKNQPKARALRFEGLEDRQLLAGGGVTTEALLAQIAALQAEAEEGKGELSVYKEKLDQLLSEETIEHAAEQMVAEQGEAEEIIENAVIANEKGEEDEKKKEEVKNSLKGLRGTKLHTTVLNALGVKTDGMSADAMRGAFKAQHQIANSLKGKKRVAGAKLMNGMTQATTEGAKGVERTAAQRMGFQKK